MQTNKNREELERAQTMFTTTVDDYIKKIRQSVRDKFVQSTVE